MRTSFKILIFIIIAGAIGGFGYWQYHKKTIIKESLDKAIAKKTDSLYFIQYDSSSIDEINGNASFYNVVLQSDDEQKKLLNSTDSLPNALFNIRVKEIAAKGIDMAGILQKQNVSAKKILLIKPVIQIINTGADRPKEYTKNDTAELYQKILGKFNSIKADTIQIINATVVITNKAGKPLTTLENININLNKFLIDSTKNYESIISYFIKDVRATVENIQLPPSKNNLRINIEKLDYDAAKRSLHVAAVRQYEANEMQPIIDLKNIQVNDLNTDAFIIQQRLKAGTITCDGGLITIYKNNKAPSANKGDQSIDLSSDLIDQAQVAGIKLGNTKIVIINKSEPGSKPFILNNAKFSVLTPVKINEGATVNNLINNADWELSADGFSFDTKNKLYKISVGNFIINNAAGTAKVTSFFLKPLVTEQQFVQQSSYAHDLYNLSVNNISLSGVNIKKLLRNRVLEVDKASFQPIIKVFNDKTLPPDTRSKIGMYPHQSLVKLDFPFYIKTASISNGSVSYRERAAKSALVGNVFFSNVNGTILNITNIPDRIKANPLLTVKASAKFLGEGNITTLWQLPLNTLNTANGAFQIEGQAQKMNALTLNPIIEPLGMASVKQGSIDKVTFNINGSNTKAAGEILFLYQDLKVEILKKEEDDKQMKKKGLVTLLANTFIKNENKNPANSKTASYERDITKSFFNLVWKTIYAGVKNTALGKKEKEEKEE